MATVDNPVPNPSQITAKLTESHTQLSYELRRLTRVATFVAILSSPSVYYWFHHHNGWSIGKSLVLTLITCAAFRGLCDILVRKVIPWPSLFGTDDQKLREDDIMNRRRAWTWRWFFRWTLYFCGVITIIYLIQIHQNPVGVTWLGIVPAGWAHAGERGAQPAGARSTRSSCRSSSSRTSSSSWARCCSWA